MTNSSPIVLSFADSYTPFAWDMHRHGNTAKKIFVHPKFTDGRTMIHFVGETIFFNGKLAFWMREKLDNSFELQRIGEIETRNHIRDIPLRYIGAFSPESHESLNALFGNGRKTIGDLMDQMDADLLYNVQCLQRAQWMHGWYRMGMVLAYVMEHASTDVIIPLDRFSIWNCDTRPMTNWGNPSMEPLHEHMSALKAAGQPHMSPPSSLSNEMLRMVLAFAVASKQVAFARSIEAHLAG